jgi:hypothetical protein
VLLFWYTVQCEAEGRPDLGVRHTLREGREEFLKKVAVMLVEPSIAALPDVDHGRAPAAPDNHIISTRSPADRHSAGSAAREAQEPP